MLSGFSWCCIYILQWLSFLEQAGILWLKTLTQGEQNIRRSNTIQCNKPTVHQCESVSVWFYLKLSDVVFVSSQYSFFRFYEMWLEISPGIPNLVSWRLYLWAPIVFVSAVLGFLKPFCLPQYILLLLSPPRHHYHFAGMNRKLSHMSDNLN